MLKYCGFSLLFTPILTYAYLEVGNIGNSLRDFKPFNIG